VSANTSTFSRARILILVGNTTGVSDFRTRFVVGFVVVLAFLVGLVEELAAAFLTIFLGVSALVVLVLVGVFFALVVAFGLTMLAFLTVTGFFFGAVERFLGAAAVFLTAVLFTGVAGFFLGTA